MSSNVWVGGMRADTLYRLRAEWVSGSSVKSGDWMPFHTGLLDGDTAPVSIPVPYSGESAASNPVLIYSARRPSAAVNGPSQPTFRAA